MCGNFDFVQKWCYTISSNGLSSFFHQTKESLDIYNSHFWTNPLLWPISPNWQIILQGQAARVSPLQKFKLRTGMAGYSMASKEQSQLKKDFQSLSDSQMPLLLQPLKWKTICQCSSKEYNCGKRHQRFSGQNFTCPKKKFGFFYQQKRNCVRNFDPLWTAVLSRSFGPCCPCRQGLPIMFMSIRKR